VALTFDDGSSPFSLQLAQILADKGATATFFDVGSLDSTSSDVVQKVANLGFPIQSHSWDHAYPQAVRGGWTVPYLRDQILRTSELHKRLTGHRSCYFRPPGGFLTNVPSAAYPLGVSVVLWTIDTLDWHQPSTLTPAATAAIVSAATATQGQEHPIVLLHAGKASKEPESQVSANRSNTVAALPAIIDWYAAQGYQFVDFQ
jgi:peptidoglycan/xylan/chitin deacetylase (PgdA/CDA1 family)